MDTGTCDATIRFEDSTPNLDRLAAQGCASPMRTQLPASARRADIRFSPGLLLRTPLKKGVLWPFDPPWSNPTGDGGGVVRDNGYRTPASGSGSLVGTGDTRRRARHQGLAWANTRRNCAGARNWRPLTTQADARRPIDCGFESYFGVDVPNFQPYAWFEQDRLTEMPTLDKSRSLWPAGTDGPRMETRGIAAEFSRRACSTSRIRC